MFGIDSNSYIAWKSVISLIIIHISIEIRVGGSKLPGLQVSSPKGTGKKTEGKEDKTEGSQGDKRIVPEPGETEGGEQGSPKKRRMDSPDRRKPDPGWRKKPTFLTGQEEVRTSTDPEPEPEKKEVMKTQELADRTPVKARIQKLNKKS